MGRSREVIGVGLVSAIGLALAWSGCGDGHDDGTEGGAPGRLTLTPASIDFLSTTPAVREVLVDNVGDEAIEVIALRWTGSSEPDGDAPITDARLTASFTEGLPLTVLPGATRTLRVTFTPDDDLTDEAELGLVIDVRGPPDAAPATLSVHLAPGCAEGSPCDDPCTDDGCGAGTWLAYGGAAASFDAIESVIATSDGGAVILSATGNDALEIQGTGAESVHRAARVDPAWTSTVVRLDDQGDIQWVTRLPSDPKPGVSMGLVDAVIVPNDTGDVRYYAALDQSLAELDGVPVSGVGPGLVVDLDMATGEVRAARRFPAAASKYGCTAAGDCVIAGGVLLETAEVGAFTFTPDDSDVFVAGLDHSGTIAWAFGISGASQDRVIVTDLARAPNGEACVVGFTGLLDPSRGDRLEVGGRSFELANGGGFALKLNADGGIAWVVPVDGAAADRVWTVDTTADGGCVIGGSLGAAPVAVGDLSSAGTAGPFVAALDADGEAR